MRTEVWTDWEGHLVNGTFPLRRFIGSSNHSAVFLTEHPAHELRDAAIKLVPADNLHTEAQQLVQWGTVAQLSHPRLVRLFDVGRCQLGGRGFLFAVMEYAEQTLAEILPKRPLSSDEVREMLPAVLEAVSFLHRNNLAHGQLKPTNIMVVNDQLKLSSDTIRSPGQPVGTIGRSYLYDPPELSTSGTSPAGDIWALGVTLVEALTQRYPVPDERSHTPLLPSGVPQELLEMVRRCLSRVPAARPTVGELDALYQPVDAPPVPPPAREEVAEVSDASPVHEESSKARLRLTTVVVALLLAAAGLVMWRFFLGDSNSAHSRARDSAVELAMSRADTPATARGTVTPSASPASGNVVPDPHPNTVSAVPVSSSVTADAATTSTAATNDTVALTAGQEPIAARESDAPASSPDVVYQVIPDISRSILARIRGHIVVKVRVLVDPAGNVVGELLESSGPSRFFARMSADAAGEWKFAPAEGRGSRVWLLRFEFDRSGATVQTTPAS